MGARLALQCIGAGRGTPLMNSACTAQSTSPGLGSCIPDAAPRPPSRSPRRRGHRRARPDADRRPEEDAGQAHARRDAAFVAGRAAAARRRLPQGQHGRRRLDEGVPAAGRRAARPPGRHQQVGVMVRTVPDRVPDLPTCRDQVRQAGRVPRRQRQRSRQRGSQLPQERGSALSELQRPQPRDLGQARHRPHFPHHVFLDANGKRQYIHQGYYTSTDALARDIRRYALGSGP